MPREHPKISAVDIPGSHLRQKYNWVPGYVRSLEIKEELEQVGEEITRVQRLPLSASGVMNEIKHWHEEYHAARIQAIANVIRSFAGSPGLRHNPFMGLHPSAFAQFPAISMDDLKEAAKVMKGFDGIDDKERQKAMDRLRKRKAELKAELTSLSIPEYFPMVRGHVSADIREAFRLHWVALQKKIGAPCAPDAADLRDSSPEEKDAWRELGVDEYLDRKQALYLPNGYFDHE